MGPVEVLWDGDGVLPEKNVGPVEVLWSFFSILNCTMYTGIE